MSEMTLRHLAIASLVAIAKLCAAKCLSVLRWLGSGLLFFVGVLLIVLGLFIAVTTDWQPTRQLQQEELARIHAASAFVERYRIVTGRLPTAEQFRAWAETAPSQLRLDGVGFGYELTYGENYIFNWYGGRGSWLWWEPGSRTDLGNISSAGYFIFGSKLVDLIVFFGFGAVALWVAKALAPLNRHTG